MQPILTEDEIFEHARTFTTHPLYSRHFDELLEFARAVEDDVVKHFERKTQKTKKKKHRLNCVLRGALEISLHHYEIDVQWYMGNFNAGLLYQRCKLSVDQYHALHKLYEKRLRNHSDNLYSFLGEQGVDDADMTRTNMRQYMIRWVKHELALLEEKA